ncbi:hypothetical protein [Erythrobacter alti]|uniref:hypothetical protein n=1 Tax=Erythrobacter alti TaxID=1896145 RepID=UPI0030F4A41C
MAIVLGCEAPVRGQDAQSQTPSETPEQSQGEEDEPNIVVIGNRVIVSPLQDLPVEQNYDPAYLASYAASTLGELLDEIRRENGDTDPSILVNGQRISDPNDIADLPVEAIASIEALPRGAAQRVGGIAGQRAYNVILRSSVRSATTTASHEFATEGGWSNSRGELLLNYIEGQDRIGLTIRGARSANLFESERDFVPRADFIPYSPVGNITPVFGTEIDPAFSALAGQPVTVVALNAGDPQPTLASLLANANTINPSMQSEFRTLRGSSRPIEIALAGNKVLTPWLSVSFNGRINWFESESFNGLPSARFRIPESNPSSPFATPVFLALNDPSRPLRSTSSNTDIAISSTLSAVWGEWRANLVTRWDDRERTYQNQFAGALLNGAGTVGDATNPFDGSLAGTIPVEGRISESTNSATEIAADAAGPLFALWTSPIWARFSTGARWVDLDASDSFGDRVFARHEYAADAGLTIPLTSRADVFLSAMGDSEIAFDIGRTDLGIYGTLDRRAVAFNWQILEWLRLAARDSRQEQPIIAELLAAPEFRTPNVPYFDPLTGETVDVTIVYGGVGGIQSEEARTRTLSLTASPLAKYRLLLNLDYLDTDLRNQIGALPIPSSAVVAAFPDRFQRDSTGTLVLVDSRSVNFARQRSEQIRFGASFNVPLVETVLTPANREAGTPARRTPGIDLQVNASHTYLLNSRTVIREGLPEIDLLRGGAVGIGGSRQRHSTDLSLAVMRGFSGFRLNAQRRGVNYLVIGSSEAPDLLTFEPLTTVDLRVIADLADVFPHAPIANGTRFTLVFDNIANERQRVTNDADIVPQAYQPVRRDPVGRTIKVELRRVF